MDWINSNDMSSVILRHYPDLAPTLRGVKCIRSVESRRLMAEFNPAKERHVTRIPTVSIADSIAFSTFVRSFLIICGEFSPRTEFWISFWNKVHPDALAVNFIRRTSTEI